MAKRCAPTVAWFDMADSSHQFLPMTVEQIIEALRNPGTTVPHEELAEVVRRKEEFVPVLIAAIENITRFTDEEHWEDCLAAFALYLLAELRESRALEPILELFAQQQCMRDEFFVDLITMDGAYILAAVGHENVPALREYVKRQDLSELVLSAALDALVLQARWGEQARDSVVQFFQELMDTNEFGEDTGAWTTLVDSCRQLHPRECLDRIRQLYQRDLIDDWTGEGLEDVEKEAEEDFASHQARDAEHKQPITNTAEAVSWWECFADPNTSWNGLDPNDLFVRSMIAGNPEQYPIIDLPAEPIRVPPKIGRNDLCPCGSGKKYKKCCLVAS
jgi:uncharacterized protein